MRKATAVFCDDGLDNGEVFAEGPAVPTSSRPVSREYPATSAATMAANLRPTRPGCCCSIAKLPRRHHLAEPDAVRPDGVHRHGVRHIRAQISQVADLAGMAGIGIGMHPAKIRSRCRTDRYGLAASRAAPPKTTLPPEYDWNV